MASDTTIDHKHGHQLKPPDQSRSSSRQLANIVIIYSNQVDEITTSLEKREESLQQRPTESELQEFTLNQLLEEYSSHEKYMTELCEYCHTIIRSKEEGQELRDNESLSGEERDEVGIQMDAMLVFYDRLKILATDRLQMLQRIIDERQRSKIDRLDKWLASMDIRLASLNNIGPDYDAIQRQLNDIRDLRTELEQKQEFLNFISKVIIFDDIDSVSLQLRSRSSISIDEQLEKMNTRWTQICQVVDDRHEKLHKADSIWRVLNVEGPQLYVFVKRIQSDLNELSDAIQNITSSDANTAFLMKLIARSEKVDQAIKAKQSFYTSLEHRVRVEIELFEDPCCMLVIELEKKLEDLQDHWNAIMRQKRMVDFSLQALSNPEATSQQLRPMIPIPDPITSSSDKDLRFDNNLDNDLNCVANQGLNHYDSPLTNSSSTGHKGSNLQLNGSLSDPSKAFDNSFSSQDTRSLSHNNNIRYIYDNEELSHDDISSATNLTSPQTTTGTAGAILAGSRDDSTYSFPHTLLAMPDFPELDFEQHERVADERAHDNTGHNCRVEEWKHSLESFSSWLRQVEALLEIECGTQDIHSVENSRSSQLTSWSKLSLQGQISLIRDIETRIRTTCQDEFDGLFLQGQQIIEDLMPELGENEYETNLKDILADLELRYHTIKRWLIHRKQELTDQERWFRLSKKIRDSCNYIINQMGEVIPETEIGVDLITLAQQQDQLLHLKLDTEQNTLVLSSIQEAKSFLKLCDSLSQQYGQQNNQDNQQTVDDDFVKIWICFRKFKEGIEDGLDKLSLHHSELSQIVHDRLARLDEVHKEMHALQHTIQDLAERLQVAEILKSNWHQLDNLSIEQLSEQLEDLKLYRERLGEIESTLKCMNSIVDWMEQFGSPLSQSNLKRVDELNNIWDSLQSSVDDRQRQIEQAFDEQSGLEQKFLALTVADLPGKWERRVATSKVPYFIDLVSNKTLWDHPKFTQLLNDLNDCKEYLYSVYRTAMKLRLIQRKLGIDRLMLEHLKEMFIAFDIQLRKRQLEIAATSSNRQSISHDTAIGVEQIILLLKTIYVKIQSEESPELDIPVAIDLTLNWLLNLYDSTRTGHINTLSLKVGLALMCCATREEKYIYMFELIANQSSRTVDARKLGTLFEICMRIPTYLGENDSFGAPGLIETSIRNCLTSSKFNPQHPNCIDINDYLSWVRSEPQFLVWLSIFHRILVSETTVHIASCKLCGMNPIVGLRYRCLKCLKFNICQKCFFTGRNIREHPDANKHQMQEYCFKTSVGENIRDLSKILRNKINPRTSRNKSA